MPKRSDLTAAQRRAVESRDALEAQIAEVMLREVRAFLADVEAEAVAALGSTVVLASGRRLTRGKPFTLGSVMRRWHETVDAVIDGLRDVTPSAASIGARLLQSELIDRVYASARAVLASAVEASWSAAQTASKLSEALSLATGAVEQTVIEMHARTEATGAWNAEAVDRMRSEGAMSKQWSAAGDSHVRPEHAEADGQVVGIDEAFIVGGESLMFPGDPDGSDAMIDNCRCVTVEGVSFSW